MKRLETQERKRSKVGPGKRKSVHWQTGGLWSRLAQAAIGRAGAPADAHPCRMAADTNCIQFFEDYWPQAAEPSELIELKRIAEDPRPSSHFRLQFLDVAGDEPTILEEIELVASDVSTAIRETAGFSGPDVATARRVVDCEGREIE